MGLERGLTLSQTRFTTSRYLSFLRASAFGVGLPSVWSALQDQLYLGDAEFVDRSRHTLSNRLLNDSEIPRIQRRAWVAPLSVFAAMPDRNDAIAKVYATGRYSQKEIAQAFDIHYATVRAVSP